MKGLGLTPRSDLADLFMLIFWSGVSAVAASDFNPYVMNGGLLVAVAGRDFVVVAADTRLIGPTGYDIIDRNHIESRLWAITPLAPTLSTFSISYAGDFQKNIFAPDGSLNVHLSNEPLKPGHINSENTEPIVRVLREAHHVQIPPVIVGSAGCQADCEHLKRSTRADLRAAMYFSEVSVQSPVDEMAIALSQVLYRRRGFPFGSYCVLGGLFTGAGGKVFVYDAIGSYEQVAVSCTGTGFELLQPILDRKFAPVNGDVEDGKERQGSSLQQPSKQVNCSVEEAVCSVLASHIGRLVNGKLELVIILFFTRRRRLATGGFYRKFGLLP